MIGYLVSRACHPQQCRCQKIEITWLRKEYGALREVDRQKPQEGEIVAVGSGVRDESGKIFPLEVKAGDRVLFGRWSGTEIKLNDEDLLIIKEADVMGVIA